MGIAGFAQFGRKEGGNPSLSPCGVGVEELSFGDNGDRTVLGSLDGKGKARDAGSEDEKISHEVRRGGLYLILRKRKREEFLGEKMQID